MSTGLRNRRAQTLQVGKRVFAAGLFWQPLRGGKLTKKDAAQFASDHGMHFVGYHHARGQVQAGFATSGPANLTKAYSLAATLTEAFGSSWIAVFVLPSGQAVMAAAHDGTILAGTDLMGPIDQVRALFAETTEILYGADQQWGRIIAPADWCPGAEPLELEAVLGSTKPPARSRMKPVKFTLTRRHVIAVACGLAVVSGAGVATKVYVDAAREAERLARIEKARLLQEEREQAEINRRIVNGPWTELPPAQVMIKMCSEGWSQVPLSIEGWVFDRGQCAVNSLTAVYRRKGASTVGVFSAAVEPRFGDPMVSENGEVAAITFSAGMPLADEGVLPSIRRQTLDLLTHMQLQGLHVSLGEVRKGGVEKGDSNQVPAWHAHSFDITTQVPPDSMFNGLSLSGLRIKTIDLQLDHGTSQMTWAVSGDIYGK